MLWIMTKQNMRLYCYAFHSVYTYHAPIAIHASKQLLLGLNMSYSIEYINKAFAIPQPDFTRLRIPILAELYCHHSHHTTVNNLASLASFSFHKQQVLYSLFN